MCCTIFSTFGGWKHTIFTLGGFTNIFSASGGFTNIFSASGGFTNILFSIGIKLGIINPDTDLCRCYTDHICDSCYVDLIIDRVEKGQVDDNWRNIPINISTNK